MPRGRSRSRSRGRGRGRSRGRSPRRSDRKRSRSRSRSRSRHRRHPPGPHAAPAAGKKEKEQEKVRADTCRVCNKAVDDIGLHLMSEHWRAPKACICRGGWHKSREDHPCVLCAACGVMFPCVEAAQSHVQTCQFCRTNHCNLEQHMRERHWRSGERCCQGRWYNTEEDHQCVRCRECSKFFPTVETYRSHFNSRCGLCNASVCPDTSHYSRKHWFGNCCGMWYGTESHHPRVDCPYCGLKMCATAGHVCPLATGHPPIPPYPQPTPTPYPAVQSLG
jgi:hypothetical protein